MSPEPIAQKRARAAELSTWEARTRWKSRPRAMTKTAEAMQVPLTQVPQLGGFISVLPGDTWNFQAWHRDTVGLGSNFTNGVEVEFL